MSPRPAPEVLDPSFYDNLGEVPEAFLAGDLYWSVELIERYAREWAIELAHALGVPQALAGAPPGSGRSTAGSLAHHLGLAPGSEVPLAWLLAELTEAGELQEVARGSSGATVRLAGELRPAHREALREAALEHDPANAPFLDLLDLAGRVWQRVVTGQVRGEAVLLGPDQLGLWLRFFSNDNPVYAVNNRLAAVAAANRLADRTRALEVGAGAGSGSSALFEELERTGRLGRLATLRLTEPAAMLRRRAVRELDRRWPGAPVEAAELDIDRPWAEQGVEPGSLDLVFGVNVLHVARDLAWTLAEARRALRPGGWLVAGECLRPRPGRPVAAEMIFLLLEGFREVRLDPELRPGPGFLTPELWVAQLENAGFERVELIPDVRLLREIHPSFATGAVCGWVGEPR